MTAFRAHVMKKLLGMICMLSAAVAWPALSDVSVGASAGTLGLGAALNYSLNRFVSVTAGVNGGSIDVFMKEHQIKADFLAYPVLVNVHPFGGSLHFTGGTFLNHSQLAISRDVSEVPFVLIGQKFFSGKQIGSLTDRLNFKGIATYLGVGLGYDPANAWGFTMDYGIVSPGKPAYAVTADGTGGAELNENLAQEASNRGTLNPYKRYPLASVGLYVRLGSK